MKASTREQSANLWAVCGVRRNFVKLQGRSLAFIVTCLDQAHKACNDSVQLLSYLRLQPEELTQVKLCELHNLLTREQVLI